ncbi:iron ABC transporter ATP-binding protein [Agromyces soli]
MPRLTRFPVAPTRRLAASLVVAAAALALTACSGGAPEPSGTASPAPGTASPSASATAEPTAPAEPSEPFAIDCAALITPEQIYAFNPNFGADPGFEPGADDVKQAVADGGTACGWVNQTSGDVIEVGVATPAPALLAERNNTAALGSSAVPTYGTPPAVTGYFSVSGGRGEAQVFTDGGVWIVVESNAFFEPGDAQQLVDAVLGNLPA